jgi:UDP-3-O-[3-hydroxymyristoyl] N-acetylglucosamine deacetylase
LVDNKDLFQNTLKANVSFSGIGLFTGEKVNISIFPAKEDSGIVFRRIDLPEKPMFPAKLENVKETDRTTFLGFGKKSIQTVEHILSALRAFNIDNAYVEVDGAEIPIGDGSANVFVKLFQEAGIERQSKKAEILKLVEPLYFNEQHVHIIALPSDEFRISFAIHHPTSDLLKSQYYSFLVQKDLYIQDIASSRTYSIYEEIEPLLKNNLMKGGSLENAVIIKAGKVMNPEGMRFPNEMVRHKVLDMIGDLSLIGNRFTAHIIAVRSGHYANILFAKKLIHQLKKS